MPGSWQELGATAIAPHPPEPGGVAGLRSTAFVEAKSSLLNVCDLYERGRARLAARDGVNGTAGAGAKLSGGARSTRAVSVASSHRLRPLIGCVLSSPSSNAPLQPHKTAPFATVRRYRRLQNTRGSRQRDPPVLTHRNRPFLNHRPKPNPGEPRAGAALAGGMLPSAARSPSELLASRTGTGAQPTGSVQMGNKRRASSGGARVADAGLLGGPGASHPTEPHRAGQPPAPAKPPLGLVATRFSEGASSRSDGQADTARGSSMCSFFPCLTAPLCFSGRGDGVSGSAAGHTGAALQGRKSREAGPGAAGTGGAGAVGWDPPMVTGQGAAARPRAPGDGHKSNAFTRFFRLL